MYTIGEVSKMFNLQISTIRYYDKEGLLLNLKRDKSGIRLFDNNNIETLKLIECLKKAGMQIKDIKQFMKWCQMGNETLQIRKDMFIKQKENIKQKIKELEESLDMIEYKCWYYDEAIKDNSEERVKNILPCNMPKEVKKNYQNSHKFNTNH